MSSVGAVFQEDGLYKIVFKLQAEGWPQVRQFSSLEDMLNGLQAVNVPFDQVMDFVLAGLQSKGKLAPLPGHEADWAQFAR